MARIAGVDLPRDKRVEIGRKSHLTNDNCLIKSYNYLIKFDNVKL